MAYTRQSLCHDLARLGLAPGDTVMVHASVRAVGPVFGGPDEIHHTVVDAVSPGGTMMMVTGCPDGFDDVGRGKFSAAEEAQILAHQPAFDPGATRADRSDGTLAEFFRSWPGTKYSDGVTMRIAARGARADWLTTDNVWNYPHGKGSPLEKLVAACGKVLLLGSDHDAVTLMHYAEHIADFPGKRIARYKVPLLRGGERVWLDCEEFNTSSAGCHANWPDRFFALIVDDFIARHDGTKLCARGKVGGSDAVLLDAAALVDHAMPIMVQTANGRPYFTETK
ncbi:MAG TPA: AAC(3) family N-acetyltransferase [Rhizomicrobium sp.]